MASYAGRCNAPASELARQAKLRHMITHGVRDTGRDPLLRILVLFEEVRERAVMSVQHDITAYTETCRKLRH